MKKKNIVLIVIGCILIVTAFYLMFGNSKENISFSEPKTKINDLKKEIKDLKITEKLEQYQEYQIKISEISILINELEGTNYEKYKDKKISLFNYLTNENKIDDYHKQIESLRENLAKKVKETTEN